MIDQTFKDMTADQRNRYLLNLLSNNTVEITFTKVDGSVRVMPCTLRSDVLPQPAIAEHHKTSIYNPEVVRVYCIDKSAWRSFRVMNVTELKILDSVKNVENKA